MSECFFEIDGLEQTERISAALAEAGIVRPTAVQRGAIGPALAGDSVLMHSGTGTGKTLAYLLPVLQWLRHNQGRAVIFAPGAELAMQVLRVATAFKDEEISAAAAISTSNRRRQRKRVQRSTRLVVGTPDRLIELFRSGKLKNTRIIVFDELDPILSSKEAGFLDALLGRSEPAVQILVASATLGKRSEVFVKRHMPGALRVDGGVAKIESITHHLVKIAPGRSKEVAIARFLQERRSERAIVFASEPRVHSHLRRFLDEHGMGVVTLNRQRSKGQRQRALDQFRRGEVGVLVATDAALRGIDVPGVQWVLHWDLPRSAEAYVHRAGRTGRAGSSGCSVVFSDRSMAREVRRLAEKLDLEFGPVL